jgi:hypothetical protein
MAAVQSAPLLESVKNRGGTPGDRHLRAGSGRARRSPGRNFAAGGGITKAADARRIVAILPTLQKMFDDLVYRGI